MPNALLETRNLSKSFDHFAALSGIDLNCHAKDQIILLGPNGAGKTTLLKTIAMLLRPTSGTLSFRGKEFSENEITIRRKIGFIGHALFLYQDLTVYDNIHFFAKLGLLEDAKQKTDETLEEFGLSGIRNKTVRSLSKGTQQRIHIARACMHSPELLLLDEPHSHLDLKAAHILTAKLDEHVRRGGAYILATHQTDLMQSLGSRWIILKDGRKIFDQNRHEMKENILDAYQKLQEESPARK
jgi:heme exporter protein A